MCAPPAWFAFVGELLLVVVAVIAGAALQRATGMGFALLAAPFIVLAQGPVSGIAVVNLCGSVTAAIILLRTWRAVQWRRYFVMVAAALVGIVPALWVTDIVPAPLLEVGVGVLVIAGLTAMLLLRGRGANPSWTGLAAAGATSGFMNTTAGVGGPAMSVYAVLTGWDQRAFAATLQPYFLTISSVGLLARAFITPDAFPDVPTVLWIAIGVACVVGLLLGEVVARHLSRSSAITLLVTVSYVGGAVTILRGVLSLVAA